MDVQAVIDPSHVKPYGVQAHVQRLGAGFIAVPLGQQLQDLHLARREAGVRLAGRSELAERADNFARDLGRHRGAAGMQFADTVQQLGGFRFLEKVAASARADGRVHRIVCFERCGPSCRDESEVKSAAKVEIARAITMYMAKRCWIVANAPEISVRTKMTDSATRPTAKPSASAKKAASDATKK